MKAFESKISKLFRPYSMYGLLYFMSIVLCDYEKTKTAFCWLAKMFGSFCSFSDNKTDR